MVYSLFKKLVKEISKLCDLKVLDYMKENIVPRLSMMGLIVKNKQTWKDCGIIFNKKANKYDEEYIWGLRFYVLLINCFKNWNLMCPEHVEDNYNKLMSNVPEIPEIDYFYEDENDIEIVNNKLQILYESESSNYQQDLNIQGSYQQNILNQGSSQQKNDSQVIGYGNVNKDFIEIQEDYTQLQKVQKNYLKYLYKDNVTAERVKRYENKFQQAYQKKGIEMTDKLDHVKLDNIEKSEIEFFQQIIEDIHFQQQLYEHLQMEEYDYEIPQQKQRAQKQILALLKNQYPNKDYSNFEQIINKNQNNKSQNKNLSIDKNENIRKYDYNYADDLNELREDKIKFPPKINIQMADSHYNSPELLENQNLQLKNKKKMLANEIKKLEKKERQLKRRSKTSNFSNNTRKNNPKVLIEQIQLKNREYEQLKAKYNSMMHEISSRLHNDVSQMHIQTSNLEKSIKDSKMNISRLRQQNQQRSSQIKYSNIQNSYTQPDYSYQGSRLLTPSMMQSNIKQSIYPEKQYLQNNKYYKQSNMSQSKYRY